MIRLIRVTFPSLELAEHVAKELLASNLIACANIQGPCSSIYRWDGEIQNDKEFIGWFKTTKDCVNAVQIRIMSLHPYECPSILTLEASANAEFTEWVTTEVSS